MQWIMPLSSTFVKKKQENFCEFKADLIYILSPRTSQGYMERPCLKQANKRTPKNRTEILPFLPLTFLSLFYFFLSVLRMVTKTSHTLTKFSTIGIYPQPNFFLRLNNSPLYISLLLSIHLVMATQAASLGC